MNDPLDRVVAAFHKLPVPDRPPDTAVLKNLVPPTTPRSLWSRTVTRTALFATAASVAAFVGLLLLGGTSPALADVVKAAEKHELVKYTRTQTTTDPHSREPVHQVAVCYDDPRAPRLRAEVHVLTLSELVDSRHVQITDGRKDRTLTVLTETLRQVQQPDKSQQALFDQLVNKFPRREATLRRAGVTLPGKTKPEAIKPLLAWLRELEANPKSVATRETTTVRYRLEDGPKTTQLWIDPATRLPTRVEHELLLPMQNERLAWAYTDFEWGPKLPAGFDNLDALFSVEPPAGYTLTDETGK